MWTFQETSSFRAIRRLFAQGSGCHSERSEESLILWRVRVPHAPMLRVGERCKLFTSRRPSE